MAARPIAPVTALAIAAVGEAVFLLARFTPLGMLLVVGAGVTAAAAWRRGRAGVPVVVTGLVGMLLALVQVVVLLEPTDVLSWSLLLALAGFTAAATTTVSLNMRRRTDAAEEP